MSNSKTTENETKLISLNAALAERAERLRAIEQYGLGLTATPRAAAMSALKAQIRGLETEKHALLQTIVID